MSATGGRRAVGGGVGRPKGLCPVCRSMQRLVAATGKLAVHGKNAAAPQGCSGRGEPPVRKTRAGQAGGSIVVGFRPGQESPTAADPGLPDIAIEPRPEMMSGQAYARRLAADPDARGGGGDVS